MKAVTTSRQNDDVFNIGPSRGGRGEAALERFIFVFIMLALGGAIFFVPDYIGRYRAEEPAPGFLAIALAVAVGLVSLVAAVLRLLRDDLWTVDVGESMLVYQTKRLVRGGYDQSGVDLEEVDRFVARLEASPRESGLYVEVDGGPVERVVDTRLGPASLREAVDELRRFLDTHGLDIPVDVESS